MEKQAVTIYTVAREARVSMATVSRVVNGNPNVKPETRDKVMAVIKKLHYRPNAVARGLASKRTTTVGVVIPEITNSYYAQLAQGIDDIATMYKYNILLANANVSGEKPIQVVRGLFAKQVDGMIYMGQDVSEELAKEFRNSTIPVVVAGSVTNDPELPTVRINFKEATKEAIEKLASQTNGTVGMMVGNNETTIYHDHWLAGYKEAMQEQGKSFSEDLVYVAHNSYDEAYKMADAVIRSGMKGIFVTDDEMAAGLLNGLTDKGIEVPANFAIISGNDTKETLMTRPMLSTVTQPMYDVGAVSMRLLTKLMDNDEDVSEQKEILLDHGFIKRQSTR